MNEIKIYILEKRKNGRNRYLISAHNQSILYDLQFFNGTRKQAFIQAEIMKDRLIKKFNKTYENQKVNNRL